MKLHSIKHLRDGCLLVLKNPHMMFLPNDPNTSQPHNLEIMKNFLIVKVSAPKLNRMHVDVKVKHTKNLQPVQSGRPCALKEIPLHLLIDSFFPQPP